MVWVCSVHAISFYGHHQGLCYGSEVWIHIPIDFSRDTTVTTSVLVKAGALIGMLGRYRCFYCHTCIYPLPVCSAILGSLYSATCHDRQNVKMWTWEFSSLLQY